ncbi:M3 family oligoendopeptidase [Alkalicoccus urumqiensis]|uniref:M3 family oligoendopeptidase n=1 Tax=Alkalicoccus urumqiensis TaxID=1548213 RepID=A0A2P6MEF6_ALKUR|nr:M3 family oligoendopeptidase [Alkalicoccus urumqiensis]PRO64684.1 M3 family oligoendopeptidase [Alkalicoccus urumqiensis]
MATFYQEKLDFTTTKEIEAAYEKLLQENIESVRQLEDWLVRVSTLQEEVEEGISGHYIDFQCYSDSETARKQYEFDNEYLEPLRKTYSAKLDEKFLENRFKKDLDIHWYAPLIKRKVNAQDLYREENTRLEVEEDRLSTRYFEITGGLTAEWEGQTLSLSELSPYMEHTDRSVREKAMRLSYEAFGEVKEELQQILSDLIQLRKKKTENAGLSNYAEYMFKEYERFDYTPEDCRTLAASVREEVLPVLSEVQEKHKEKLGFQQYRPWDIQAPAPGEKPLKPFENRAELVSRASSIFEKLDPRFQELIETMDARGMLDLTARKGKAPGGFCSNLPISNLSFIFMNASGVHDDMITLLHEMGHCIHNDFTSHFRLHEYKETPMEAAELASMSMELLTMDHWHHYYQDEKELNQAKRDQFTGVLSLLPIGVVVDQFQHWMYENPDHSEEERLQKFQSLHEKFGTGVVDWDGLEEWRSRSWLRILHIFEVPFYFIDYVIAQIGALQVYKNYKQNPDQALQQYKEALKLGSSVPLPDVYKAAGIKFDFSKETLHELMVFVQDELRQLEEA